MVHHGVLPHRHDDSGGSATGSGWGSPGEVREVTAAPASGYEFVGWIGTGIGSYTGTNNPATVTLNGPITQTVRFLPLVYPLTMAQEGGGTVTPSSGPQPRDSTVEITAAPGWGYVFGGWDGAGDGSYTGPDSVATVTMDAPITQTAVFENGEFELQVLSEEGGSVAPASGSYTSFSTIQLQATPDAYHVFRAWKGSGDGSYTGTDATAPVTLNGPITEVAHFDPSGYELTLSLSDTDPYVHTGPPVDFGYVYLWLACGSANAGLYELHADVSGDMSHAYFAPRPSILQDGGTSQQLRLIAVECQTGPVILGHFLVVPLPEGTMCLTTTAQTPELYIETCGGNRFTWPADLKVTGVSTSGVEPCRFGRGCADALPVGTTPVAVPTPLPLPEADRLLGGFPNPFVETTSIRFALAQSGRVTLTVYDVTGRRVRRLVDSEHPAGIHAATWSGRDDAGRIVPAGVYFVRLRSGDLRETRRVARLGPRR